MKKIFVGFLLLWMTSMSHATTIELSSDQIFVREHWISLTKSYDIETKTHHLGTLYRRFFSLLLTYDFYDPQNIKTATARAKFFSLGAHLDVYDPSNIFLGSVDEKIFTFFPTFEILGPDASTKLARAEMNFWGTRFDIYDPATHHKMAEMHRSFFRLKDDWIIRITNQALLNQKNIDTRVLMTVLAVQNEIEDWQTQSYQSNNIRAQQTQLNDDILLQRVKTLNMKNELDNTVSRDEKALETLTKELDEGFNATHLSMAELNQTGQERMEEFTSYCLSLVESQTLPEGKRKAILMLLNLRLQGHVES